ncbi:MAG: MFS transporter [Deltaproteobacteria bacterium]|nr:MFS transporter [Deltaproteobacteria bacterium]
MAGGSWLKIDERKLIRIVPFGMDLIMSIFFLAAPLTAIELGANPIELGLIGTFISSLHVLLSNVSGRLSDRVGRRILILAGPMIFVASCLLMMMANRVTTILALAALNGLALGLFWAPFQAWIAELRTERGLAYDLGSFNMSWTAAHLVGPALAGFLFSLHPRLPFLLAAGIALLLMLFTRASVEERDSSPEESPKISGAEESTWRRKFLYAAWVANAASWFIIGNARYQFPKLARELSAGSQTIGLLISCIGLAQFLTFFLLQRSASWHFRRLYLWGAQLLAVTGSFLLFFGSEQVIFALALMLFGICCGVSNYSSLYYSVSLGRGKGRSAGFHESIVGSGAFLGPILGGIAAYYAGLRAPYILCVAVLLAAIAAESFLIKKKEPQDLMVS